MARDRPWLSILFAAALAGLAACQPAPGVAPTAEPTTVPGLTPTVLEPTQPPTPTPQATVKTYTNDEFGVSIQYPADWFGPDIYKTPDGFRFEVGTDIVYPYGTGLDERQYNKQDSYYIVVQYTRRPSDSTVEGYQADQPWLQELLPLLTMQDGESRSDLRSLQTRVREVNRGDFQGVEYIATLSESAQTELFYARETFLINANSDTVRITGSPNNVRIADAAQWKADYQRVDDAHLEFFRALVGSLDLPSLDY